MRYLLPIFVLAAGLARAESVAKVGFNHEIRPLLSDRCFVCHGPDDKTRESGLRLDTREGALKELSNGRRVINPGKPEESELIRRLESTDPSEKMPPADSHLTLTVAEIGLIRRWIEQGAEYERHWAFVTPKTPPVPDVRLIGWPRNEIDAFVLEKLEAQGLQPALEASREQLIRRLAFDLTGLPPSPADVEAFLKDNSPGAYEALVDKYLASESFGERMAGDWLDVARYADTHGYQADRYRATWPWRDWVVKAFNQNLPFDQFLRWQLAGDLLPNATKEQRLATAFNRLHMQTEEGGSVEEEFRVAYVVDRVNTMGTAFMAMTFDCSRCHDHKYDPVSQRDFYQLFSLFNNIDESGQTSHFTDSMPVPTLLLSDEATDATLAGLNKSILAKENKRAGFFAEYGRFMDDWWPQRPLRPEIQGAVARFDFEELKDGKFENLANKERPAVAVEGPAILDSKSGKGLGLNGDNGVAIKGVGAFSRVDPFTVAISIRPPAKHLDRAVVWHRSQAALDAGSRGIEMLLEEGKVAVGLHHMWPGNALKVVSAQTLPPGEWSHITVAYDGSSRASGVQIYLNGTLMETKVVRDNLWKDVTYERADPDFGVGHRFRDNGFNGGQVDDLALYSRRLTSLEVAQIAGRSDLVEALAVVDSKSLDATRRAAVLEYYLENHNPIYRRFLDDLRSARAQQSRLINPIPEIMVLQELDSPRPARILNRGAYDAPGDVVVAGVPESIFPASKSTGMNRLDLVDWLLDPGHPLTARVAVNRLWQTMFGRGLVATSDNFGSQGELPSHPALLDWLAVQFREEGWNTKAMLKRMALSATYRQSSQARPATLAADFENRLLGRASVRRLSAEMLRDNALATSGLLVNKIGGAPVKPYQPAGLWEEKSGARYDQDKGDGLYRRTLYSFWKRTSPHPALMAFDAAERNVCVMRRQATSTPLQALILLNDPQFMEASRFIAQRMLKEGGSNLEGQLAHGFKLLTQRAPRSRELAVLKNIFQEQRALFESRKADVLSLLAVGESVNDPGLDPIDLAAATMVASTLLSFDESVMLR